MAWMLVVHRLAGVLLEMQALDADCERAAVEEIDRHLALADDRLLVLRDLIALRKIRVEVVLAVEDAADRITSYNVCYTKLLRIL